MAQLPDLPVGEHPLEEVLEPLISALKGYAGKGVPIKMTQHAEVEYALEVGSKEATGNASHFRVIGTGGGELIKARENRISFFGVNSVARQPADVALTADLTYGTTERDMLNTMYAALIAYGLLGP